MILRLAPKDFVGRGTANRACTTPEEPGQVHISEVEINSRCAGRLYHEIEPPCPKSTQNGSLVLKAD